MSGRYRDRQPDIIDDIKKLTQRVSKLESVNRITHTAIDFSALRFVNGSISFSDSSGNVFILVGKFPEEDRFGIQFFGEDGELGAELGQLESNERGVALFRDGVVIKALDLPGIQVLFDHVPAINESDLLQVIQTHDTAGELMTMWINERGMLRLEQVQGSRFDNLYLAIMDGAADPAGSGWPFSVERRDSGVRTRIGGLNWYGQYATEFFPWVDITDIDPDATGNYTTTGTTSGAADLQVRNDTSEIIRMQGRLVATDMVANERLMAIPSPYFPLAKRLLRVGVDDGTTISCEFAPTGYVTTKASISGTVELSFDDITFSRFFVEQPTGSWTVETASIAIPDTSSPLTMAVSSESDTGYVLFLSRSTATDVFTSVTDDGSNTWNDETVAPTSGSVGRRVEIWTVIPSSPFANISIAFTGGGTAYATLVKVTGHDPADFVDVVNSGVRSSSTTPAAYTVTPTNAGSLALAMIQANPNQVGSITPDAGWTDVSTDNGGPDIVFQVDPPLSSIGVSWTLATAAGSGHAIIVLNPAP